MSTLYNHKAAAEQRRLSYEERRSFSEDSKAQSKSKKVEEWTNFPLVTDEQRQAWYLRKRELLDTYRSDGTQNDSNGIRLGILPDASPLSIDFEETLPNTDTTLPIYQAETGPDSGLRHAWNSEAVDESNHGNEEMFHRPATSDMLMANAEVPRSALAGVTDQGSPETHASASDRWRKYF